MLKFENKTNGRFYYINVTQDLLGDLVLTVFRGGKHAHVVRHRGFTNRHSLELEIEKIRKTRLQHGYSFIS